MLFANTFASNYNNLHTTDTARQINSLLFFSALMSSKPGSQQTLQSGCVSSRPSGRSLRALCTLRRAAPAFGTSERSEPETARRWALRP